MALALTVSHGKTKKKCSYKKTISILFTVLLIVCLCSLPYQFLLLTISVDPYTVISALANQRCGNIYESLIILSLLHSSLNPILSNFMSKELKKVLFNLLCWSTFLEISHQKKTPKDTRVRLRSDTTVEFIEEEEVIN